jgi:hypothetical protein
VLFSKRVRIFIFAALAVVATLAVIVGIFLYRFQPIVLSFVRSALQERYNSQVELGDLRVSLFPTVRATGKDLVLHFQGHRDLPPLVRVKQFTIDAGVRGFFQTPKRITRVRLEGLEIHVPPKDVRRSSGPKKPRKFPFVLEELVADGARLEMTPKDPAKDPLVFEIHELTMNSVGIGTAMKFHAKLENPKPPGLIHSDGEFGPWDEQEPSDTHLAGKYTFRNADLGVFHGIAGTLSSDGDYKGELDTIEVHGTTETPNFSLSTADRPMPLHTEFQATVDGTNGNTVLHPVKARLGNSNFEVSGSIERGALEKHKTISLETKGHDAHIEDFLRLSVKSASPPMKGGLAFESKVVIPPGSTPVVTRLQLDGRFGLNGIRFISEDVQGKIASLSHHAQGDPKADDPNVTADFRGRFHLRDGQLALPDLEFQVPGADVKLAGKYALQSGELDFEGTARLHATISEMTTGVKRVLLKPLDPLFRHDGAGAVLPIRIGGTRGQPSFKLDIGKALHLP